MVQQFKCVVFDLDGTLLDTSEGLISSVRYTLARHGLEQLDEDVIKTFIGPPIQNSFKRIYGFDDNKISDIVETFRNRYKGEDLFKAKPYDGIYNMLERLTASGIKLAIATYKRQDYAQIILEHFGFHKYTDFIFGSDFEGLLKKKDIIELALKMAGINNYSEAVMVGDSDNDAIGAESIGVKFIGVTYGFGFGSKEEILGFKPIGVAQTTSEIADIILGG